MENSILRNKKQVVVCGHFCVDIIPDINSKMKAGDFFTLLQPGQLIEVGKAIFSTGGAASNTGITMHILDNDVSIVAMVGNDMLGKTAVELVKKVHPRLVENILVNAKTSTSYTIILDPPGVDRMFLHNPGSNDDLKASDIPASLVADVTLFHFGYPQLMAQFCSQDGQELFKLYAQMKSQNITTSLDVTFPDPSSFSGKVNWRSIFKQTLPYVDIFSPSIEEILYMLMPDKFRELSESGGVIEQVTVDLLGDVATQLLNMGAKIVLLKLGRKGLYLQTAGEEGFSGFGRGRFEALNRWYDRKLWTSSYKVNVVGTTGAGDATIGGFLTSILHEMPPEVALNFAAGVGACNVEAYDAIGGVKSFDETEKRIDCGWEKNPLQCDSDGWIWDSNYNLWTIEGQTWRSENTIF